ncbi:phenylacetate--CoA ligase family protein [Stenotrophomonas sp. W1S232]|uniref:Phenylacetate--CoA ligase family protein n=1 Tax=Stenotrophomonas koreensis TaxID=266128 RepID=A0A7W3V0Y6_9GAMM|nr:phenylacetate--CoA ligase family protein [Stenotrophomonas koreensis]MBB1117464.1 phenylacetate--CoA ligase family protein [Stenotrophomonas koreensis]
MSYATYFESFDVKKLLEQFPLDQAFTDKFKAISREQLRAEQNEKFLRCVARAWQIPFYQRLWGNAGIKPEDIRSLDDITKLPVFGKHEIMASVEAHPPLGDFHGWQDGTEAGNKPLVFHTTSGTTGRPQPLVFSPHSREVQSLLLARLYRWQGMKPGDVVHSVYGHGMINGGHYVREAITHYTQALFCSAGTGIEMRSAQQVQLMKNMGTNVIVGFADYIKKLADVAREQGLEPGKDIPVRMICGHLGRESRESLSAAWGGVELYDWYGVGDTGAIAGQGPDQDGLYLMEDAQYVEILGVDDGQIVADGEVGDMVVTCLYKDDIYPIIRFNTHDVTRVLTTPSSLGVNLRRIEGFLGRSDNMVKIRGINVFPQAMAPILEEHAAFAGEFICMASRDATGRDELAVHVETHAALDDEAVNAAFCALLRQRLGVEMGVVLCAPGSLAPLTGIEVRQKPVRLIDKRFA